MRVWSALEITPTWGRALVAATEVLPMMAATVDGYAGGAIPSKACDLGGASVMSTVPLGGWWSRTRVCRLSLRCTFEERPAGSNRLDREAMCTDSLCIEYVIDRYHKVLICQLLIY